MNYFKSMRWLYSFILYCLTPLFVGRLFWRSVKQPAFRARILERFGWVHAETMPVIWLHAVSVGETMAARPIIEALLSRYPKHRVWVTSTTLTGSETVKRLFGERVAHSYCPYDLPDVIARFLRRIQPKVCLIMETEVWANWYHACDAQGVPLYVINARLSKNSVRGYQRFKRLVMPTLQCVTQILARTSYDAAHFLELGISPSKVKVCGDIKFELQLPSGIREAALDMRALWGKRRVWVAASTHQGEDEIVLAIFQALRVTIPDALLILVPRHPERFEAVFELAQRTGLTVQRRSGAQSVQMQTAILLGDSMGELLLWYACSDVAFIGGSLLEQVGGGHNPLEAAALGVPICSGAYVDNFADMYPALVKAQGAVLCQTTTELTEAVRCLLTDPVFNMQTGQAAAAFFQQHRGALACIMQTMQISGEG